MAECPFCHGKVELDLVLHGGTCPHCFGEVPGEETPTDPGEEVKAQMLEADRQHARRRALMPVFVATPLVALVVAFAAWSALQTEPTVEPWEADAAFLEDLELDFQAYVAPEEPEEPVEVAEVRSQPRRQGRAIEQLGEGSLIQDGGSLSEQLAGANQGSADAGGSRVRKPSFQGDRGGPGEIRKGEELSGTTSDRAAMGDINLTMSRGGMRILESEEDFRQAVKEMWRARAGQLQQCYDRRLKEDETLRGQWKLSFTISKDGAITDTSASGVQRQDPELEACISRQMGAWSIRGRLEKPRSLTLPINFGL